MVLEGGSRISEPIGIHGKQSAKQPAGLWFCQPLSGQSKVFETPPTAVVPGVASQLGTMPLSFTVTMDRLPPGEYDCQVTILDPMSLKSNFWRAPVLLVH
jgi:hypothetical protein